MGQYAEAERRWRSSMTAWAAARSAHDADAARSALNDVTIAFNGMASSDIMDEADRAAHATVRALDRIGDAFKAVIDGVERVFNRGIEDDDQRHLDGGQRARIIEEVMSDFLRPL
ncbi:MAG: hypothetical protein ABMA64_04410 [Myxococcota bacterium]